MVGLHTCGQVLRAEHLEVFIHFKDFSFSVQVVYGRHLDAPSGDTEGGVLNYLKFVDGALTGVWKPDRRCIGEEGADEGLKGDQKGLLLLAPVCSC